jgi:addiction module HigA family antidote
MPVETHLELTTWQGALTFRKPAADMSKAIKNQYTSDFVTPPGDTLLETITAVGMTEAELAERAGCPNKTIVEIIQGKTEITPDMALQLEAVLGVPASFWMNRENQYREAESRLTI